MVPGSIRQKAPSAVHSESDLHAAPQVPGCSVTAVPVGSEQSSSSLTTTTTRRAPGRSRPRLPGGTASSGVSMSGGESASRMAS